MDRKRDLPGRQAGIIHLLPLLLIVALAIGAYVAISRGLIKLPSIPGIGQKGPKVELKTEYKNPFKKETQYVNPFETYKNPFTVNK